MGDNVTVRYDEVATRYRIVTDSGVVVDEFVVASERAALSVLERFDSGCRLERAEWRRVTVDSLAGVPDTPPEES